MKSIDKNNLWKFIKEHEPRLLCEPFGKFDVKVEKLFFVIECELITQLENPLIDTKLKTCKVNKKSFINWKNKQNKIIFYD